MFTDLMKPTTGRCLINNIDIKSNKKEALKSVGTLIEVPRIYPYLSPKEALTMMAKIRGIAISEQKSCIENTIASVNMTDWTNTQIRTFSKGMKQRICIASALLSDPKILLLDEPTQGLDPRGMNEIRQIIKSIKAKGKLIFMSSHLLSEVFDICDEVVIINKGKILEYKPISDIIAKFMGGKHAIEIELRIPMKEEKCKYLINEIPTILEFEKIDEKHYKIYYKGDLTIQEKILSDLVKANINLVSYKSSWMELEDVYLKLVKDVR